MNAPADAPNVPLHVDWQRDDYSRIPYRLYHDPEVYALEMERIFRGDCWSYLALEAELPKPGDFRTTWMGDTPVVVTRGEDGRVNAWVNRCAHRGAMVVRKTHGNASEHVCIYHRWCYSLEGDIQGIPFRRGIKGDGGMPADFDPKTVAFERRVKDDFGGLIRRKVVFRRHLLALERQRFECGLVGRLARDGYTPGCWRVLLAFQRQLEAAAGPRAVPRSRPRTEQLLGY